VDFNILRPDTVDLISLRIDVYAVGFVNRRINFRFPY